MRLCLWCALLLAIVAPAGAQEAFLDRLSAAPGETVQVYVSTAAATYRVHVDRSLDFGQRVRLLSSPALPGGVQASPVGSWAWAASRPSLAITGAISLESWVRPSRVSATAPHGILGKYAEPDQTAYMISLEPGGQVSFYLAASGTFSAGNQLRSTAALPLGQWTHIVATFDGTTKRLWIDGALDVSQPWSATIFDTAEPVRVGAFASNGIVGNTFDGDIDSPAIHARALTAAEISQRHAERALYGGANPGVLAGTVAQWNIEEMEGRVLADATTNANDLTLQNHATRGIPGPLPPEHGGMPINWAVRFASDDAVNPPWSPTFSFTVPQSWSGGFHLVQVAEGERSIDLPFVVRPDPGRRARIAVLANTNTWTAYNSWSKSLYTNAPGGEINYFVGMRQPNPAALANLHRPGFGFSPRVDAERYLYAWLRREGYAFDLHGDLDLHRDPRLLDGYGILIISGHSEYWSSEMIDHVEAFQARGGSLINLSGNTMWTRVTYDSTFRVMEGRKYPHLRGKVPPGERWHSQAGQVLGGNWRCLGRPEHRVLGTGFGIIMPNGQFGEYAVVDPRHWVFAGTAVAQGTLFGRRSQNGNSILGHEIDLVDPTLSPPNVELLATGVNLAGDNVDISSCSFRVKTPVTVGGDMIYFDHPGGGGVFGAPTVAFGGAVGIDPVAAQVLRNVLARFLGATCIFHNGSGINPTGFDCVTAPVLGSTWRTTVATTASTVATAVGLSATPGLTLLFGGEILLGPSSGWVFHNASGSHAIPIPACTTLLGARLFTQGFRVETAGGAPRPELLNGQILIVGN